MRYISLLLCENSFSNRLVINLRARGYLCSHCVQMERIFSAYLRKPVRASFRFGRRILSSHPSNRVSPSRPFSEGLTFSQGPLVFSGRIVCTSPTKVSNSHRASLTLDAEGVVLPESDPRRSSDGFEGNDTFHDLAKEDSFVGVCGSAASDGNSFEVQQVSRRAVQLMNNSMDG